MNRYVKWHHLSESFSARFLILAIINGKVCQCHPLIHLREVTWLWHVFSLELADLACMWPTTTVRFLLTFHRNCSASGMFVFTGVSSSLMEIWFHTAPNEQRFYRLSSDFWHAGIVFYSSLWFWSVRFVRLFIGLILCLFENCCTEQGPTTQLLDLK